MKKLLLFILAVAITGATFAQSSKGINYQAVARDGEGNLIKNTTLKIRVGIVDNTDLVWQEDHEAMTDNFGLFNIVIGSSEATKTGGSLDNFGDIDWGSGNYSLQVSVDAGNGFNSLGASSLNAVPYALHTEGAVQDLSYQDGNLYLSGDPTPDPINITTLINPDAAWSTNLDTIYTSYSVGIGTNQPNNSLLAIQSNDPQVEKPLFEVRNDFGNPVFAVYNDGVIVYVDEDKKGVKGGFAVGGYSSSKKGATQEYLRITPDSVRIWVPETTTAKAGKGGFAVGGYNTGGKLATQDYLMITPDSTRIYVSDAPAKAGKGGFAVGGYNSSKAPTFNFLEVNKDRTNVFYDTTNTAKGFKGGFAVGGYNSGKKGDPEQLMSLTTSNYLIGQEAGINITDGIYNTFFGYNAGLSTTEGSDNIFIGSEAGYSNTSGSRNIMMGNYAGYSSTTGYNNVILGDLAGFSNNKGAENVMIGTNAGLSNFGEGGEFDASYNVFIGYNSGYTNTSGGGNVFLGYYAGWKSDTGNYQTAVGHAAGAYATGEWNTFIGAESGFEAITGDYNTYVGIYSGKYGEQNFNTYLGYKSGTFNTGEHNVFLGAQAGYGDEFAEANTGSYNTYVGIGAGETSTTGSENVYLGYFSGYNNTSGIGNIFIGHLAGYYETGSEKLYIANTSTSSPLIYGEFDNQLLNINGNAGVNVLSQTGYGLVVDLPTGQAEEFTLYSFGDVYSEGDYYSPSGYVYAYGKSGADESGNALTKLKQLNTGYYTSKSKAGVETQRYGVVSEDMEKIFPELVKKNMDGETAVNYNGLVPVLIEALKEQQTQIEQQQAEIEELRRIIENQ